jgi:guanylate kinase
MPKFAVAFITPEDKPQLKHCIVESPEKETALKTFFLENAKEFYSDDEQGYYYFKEDFFDESYASGNIIELE